MSIDEVIIIRVFAEEEEVLNWGKQAEARKRKLEEKRRECGHKLPRNKEKKNDIS